ncbi:LysR family transcriptional regulator [Primorskyibacter marinus]|uniref:LysR family transcriptional regulator n=1 Tax=Primorskyibacter marinus TaxID=1977320 RepID=UPI0018E51F37|nr:LysR family transcriptional regulator [Primorskyibacter marinus]
MWIKMSPTLKQLEILKAVVTTGSISQAARLVGLSQPTLSQQIAKMEKSLDTQLFVRGRSSVFHLTAPGEYWYQFAVDILDRHASAEIFHETHFKQDRIQLRFSSPYALRLWFFNKVAELAVSDPKIGGLEFVGSRNSSDVLDMLSMHQINCGVVNEAFLTGRNSNLHVTRVFSDRTVWLVPEAIPHEVIQTVINTCKAPEEPNYVALKRYVDLGTLAPWRDHTQGWFRSHLPLAMPFFRCPENVGAARLVAEGLATAHVPLSLTIRLPQELRSRVRMYEIDGARFNVSFVAPKHYQSIPAFVAFQKRLCEDVRSEFEGERQLADLKRVSMTDPCATAVGPAIVSAAE